MGVYWKSEYRRFASGGGVTCGWQPTLAGYLRRYPDKAAMGSLAFTEREVSGFSPDAAVVFGKWELTREKGHPWGLLTLTRRKISGQWVIVNDHTSNAEK